MTDASIQHSHLMLNLFTCLEQKFVELVYTRPLN